MLKPYNFSVGDLVIQRAETWARISPGRLPSGDGWTSVSLILVVRRNNYCSLLHSDLTIEDFDYAWLPSFFEKLSHNE